MKKLFIVGSIFLFLNISISCTKSDSLTETGIPIGANNIDGNKLLDLVNQVRSTGTYCGDTYYPSVGELSWSIVL
ncbi:hypothetical protein [Ancylomarina longa]|uniref:Uncharacterized protein n=1 Tax=Ancylomarina longa TaxID=2487017 RepID=A0A434AES0_9BACT|nr:hypothetical protein [Ancylomarina longa]RUT72891.1 hypothetical protein DLK05_16205 [Ancylomarina longa]